MRIRLGCFTSKHFPVLNENIFTEYVYFYCLINTLKIIF
jgi:hypothetical protein